jgi:hypothetical protein
MAWRLLTNQLTSADYSLMATEIMIPEATEIMIPEATEIMIPEATEIMIPEATEIMIPEATENTSRKLVQVLLTPYPGNRGNSGSVCCQSYLPQKHKDTK